MKPPGKAPATQAIARVRIREDIPALLEGDLWSPKDMYRVAELVWSDTVMSACETVTGPLE